MQLKIAVVLATALAAAARADNEEVYRMRAIGMPILFIVFFAAAIFLSRSQLLAAIQGARNDVTIRFCFGSALLNMALSIFLFFSASFNYGLMSCLLALLLAAVCGDPASLRRSAHPLMLINGAWLMIMLGLPDSWSSGIINSVGVTACQNFYNSAGQPATSIMDAYCKASWLVFLAILVIVMICAQFLSLLLLIGAAMSPENAEAAAGTGMSAGLLQKGGGPSGYAPAGVEAH